MRHGSLSRLLLRFSPSSLPLPCSSEHQELFTIFACLSAQAYVELGSVGGVEVTCSFFTLWEFPALLNLWAAICSRASDPLLNRAGALVFLGLYFGPLALGKKPLYSYPANSHWTSSMLSSSFLSFHVFTRLSSRVAPSPPGSSTCRALGLHFGI